MTFTSSDPSVLRDDHSLQVPRELPKHPNVQKPDDDFFETTELLNAADASVQKYTGRRNVNYLNKAGWSLELTFQLLSNSDHDE